MDFSVDIIEVLDSGQYKLNEKQLLSILSKAQNCHNFALISIIGTKLSGKTFLMNCLISYLESNQKDIWPKDHTIKCDHYFNKTFEMSKKRVHMWSRPFILEVEGNRTAVFLMDSSHVFESTATMGCTKLVEDITGLFFNTSSTVIYLKHKYLMDLESLNKLMETTDCFEELFILIRDWDSKYRTEFNPYLFGSKSGDKYLAEQFKDHNLGKYFEKIECHLLPSSGKVISNPDFIFNDLKNDFNREISRLLTSKLLNVDEMTLKRHPIRKDNMSWIELFDIFQSYVNKLNDVPVFISFGINLLNNDSIESPTYSDSCPDDSRAKKESNLSSNSDIEMIDISNEEQISTKDVTDAKEVKYTLENNLKKFVENLCDEYKGLMVTAFNSDDFNPDRFSSLHKNKKTQCLNKYEKLKNRNEIDKKLINNFREELIKEIEGLMPGLRQQSEELIKQLEAEYNDCLIKSLNAYENQINNSIEKIWNLKFNEKDLNDIHNRCKNSTEKLFEEKIENLSKTNKNIANYFKNQLKRQINSKLEFYSTSLKTFTQYLKEWEILFKNQKYFEINVLEEKHSFLKNKFKSGLNPLFTKLIDNSFKELCKQYRQIKDKEELFIGQVKDDLVNKFNTYFIETLKTGFFNRQDVEKKFDRLLNYTLNTFNTVCGLKSNQNTFTERLKSEIVSNKSKSVFNYIRNSNEAKTLIERAKRESIALYSDKMRENISEKTSINTNDFHSISSSNLRKALKHNEEILKSIESDLNQDFYQFIYDNNVKEIKSKIKRDGQMFSQKFIKISPTTELKSSTLSIHFGRRYLFAGVYENQYKNILDKSGQQFRPNCIAFGDQILCGNGAKEWNKKFGENIDQDFDIKNLLLRKMSNISNEELSSYPFEFANNNGFIRVVVNNESVRYDFSIESLIALQVLDIKSDAEKQMSTEITRAVFTVPTHYTILEKNAFRNVAEIAGLESVHILSEMTAAAIGYSFSLKPEKETNLLIVSVNDFDCEGAVIELKDRVIKYRCYSRVNLISDQKYTFPHNLSCFNSPDENDKICNNFKKLMDKLIKNYKINKRDIHHILLLIATQVFDSIKSFISETFKTSQIIDCKESDLVVKGSTIFGEYMFENNSEFSFEASEVAFHSLKCKYGNITYERNSVINLNTRLPHSYETKHRNPEKNELPIEFLIYQDETLVSVLQLCSIIDEYWSNFHKNNWDHIIIIELTQFADLKLTSKLIYNYGKNEIVNQLVEINLGMTANELNRDKEFIKIIENKTNEIKIQSEKNSIIDKIKEDLNGLYLSIKKRFDANKELRGLKKKRIEEQLNKTQKLLQNSGVELKTYENQKTILKEIETMKF